MGSTPSISMSFVPWTSSTFRSATFSSCLSFFCFDCAAECFLGDSRIGTGFFYLSLFGLTIWVSMGGVGFGLGDLDAVSIGAGASILTTFGETP